MTSPEVGDPSNIWYEIGTHAFGMACIKVAHSADPTVRVTIHDPLESDHPLASRLWAAKYLVHLVQTGRVERGSMEEYGEWWALKKSVNDQLEAGAVVVELATPPDYGPEFVEQLAAEARALEGDYTIPLAMPPTSD